LFEFGDSGGTRLFKVYALGAIGNGLGEKAWVVGCASTDESETGCGRRREFL
jgi:hypothetical protein